MYLCITLSRLHVCIIFLSCIFLRIFTSAFACTRNTTHVPNGYEARPRDRRLVRMKDLNDNATLVRVFTGVISARARADGISTVAFGVVSIYVRKEVDGTCSPV